MKQKFLLFILCFVCIHWLSAQSGFVSFGGTASGSTGCWTFTVGQPAYTNTAATGVSWSEGVQQPLFISCPASVTDYDSQEYGVIRIGNYCWMTENLRSQHYSDGTEIEDVRVYNDDEANATLCGRLYTTPAATLNASTLPAQGVCPEGWQLPTQVAYNDLSHAVPNILDLRSTTGWLSENGTNASGFNLYPAGFYNGITQRYENRYGKAYLLGLADVSGVISPVEYASTYYCDQWLTSTVVAENGYSVRCVKQ